MRTLIITAFLVLFGSHAAMASEHFLKYRYNTSDTTGHLLVYENNASEKWAIGGKLVGGDNGAKNLYSWGFLKSYPNHLNLQFGLKANVDADDGKRLGAAVRHKGQHFGWNVVSDNMYLKALNGSDDKVESWNHFERPILENWNYGFELRYFHTGGSTHNFSARPIFVSYNLTDVISPFVMLDRTWKYKDGEENIDDSVFTGVILRF
ncbi:hypothetical protein ACFL2R_00165 [Patescibacteria group bacterium]